jgi:hypothetical protein
MHRRVGQRAADLQWQSGRRTRGFEGDHNLSPLGQVGAGPQLMQERVGGVVVLGDESAQARRFDRAPPLHLRVGRVEPGGEVAEKLTQRLADLAGAALPVIVDLSAARFAVRMSSRVPNVKPSWIAATPQNTMIRRATVDHCMGPDAAAAAIPIASAPTIVTMSQRNR